jgi:hypothetical protein
MIVEERLNRRIDTSIGFLARARKIKAKLADLIAYRETLTIPSVSPEEARDDSLPGVKSFVPLKTR